MHSVVGAKSHYSVKYFAQEFNKNIEFSPNEGMNLAKLWISKMAYLLKLEVQAFHTCMSEMVNNDQVKVTEN